MESEFWIERWQKREIGFHEGAPNALLTAHWTQTKLPEGSRVFLPLCGKTRDIAWLLEHGYRVTGAELAEDAVAQLFEELSLTPQISKNDRLTRYRSNEIDIFVGDIFDLSAQDLGPVQAIYDRAALVALTPEIRRRYAPHLIDITKHASQLLICFEYDQNEMAGPPFSVTKAEIDACYSTMYKIEQLQSIEVAGGLKGRISATETIWLLTHA